MATIVVEEDYEVPSDETLEFVDENAFQLIDDLQNPSPDLTIAGAVTITATTAASVEGVVAAGGFYTNSDVLIEAGGSLVIHSTTPNGTAAGMDASWSPSFTNFGLLEVSADSHAIGVRTLEPGLPFIDNRGEINVTANGTAMGVFFIYGGVFQNVGDIEVRSEEGYAFGVAMSGLQTFFNNDGTIRVTTGENAYGGVAVEFSPYYRQGSGFINYGWIEGPTALRVTMNGSDGTVVTITNHGTMVGLVDLGDGPSRFDNTGEVIGDINLGEGDDVYDGREGTVSGQLSGGDGSDHILGGVDAESFEGGEGNDTIASGAGDDWIAGGAGADILAGELGEDVLEGGGGDDIFIIDDAFDTVHESFDGGLDTVQASVSFTLGQDIENLTLTGALALNGVGNDLSNSLIGNEGANLLQGLGGGDRLWGQAGSDILEGGIGDDNLNGGAGDDILYGGEGRDVFIVDSAGDIVIEYAGEGVDRVEASVSFSLVGQALENLTLTGSGAVDGTGNELANALLGNGAVNQLVGAAGNDTLYGRAGADTLYGNAGDDRLDGGAGDDTLYGGAGRDLFIVDSAGDVVVENTGEGPDRVEASVSFSLAGQALETLTLTGSAAINGTGNELANTIAGNAAANQLTGGGGNDTLLGRGGADTLYGDAGDDRLDGGTGGDTMYGGAGRDVFIVDSLTDVVIEVAGESKDHVSASVSFSLAGQDIESLTLAGSAAINATGNHLSNTIIGNAAANLIQGGGGSDTLTGGAGADTFVYTAISDSIPGSSDVIRDLQSIDLIDLSAIDANGATVGDDAFVRIGNADPFTAAGQLRLSYDGEKTLLQLNTDADAAPEMTIVLLGNRTGAATEDNWLL